MNKRELLNLLSEYKDEDEILLFPEASVGVSDEGEEIRTGPGIGIFNEGELIYLGELQTVEEVDISDEDLENFDIDFYDDDLDIDDDDL